MTGSVSASSGPGPIGPFGLSNPGRSTLACSIAATEAWAMTNETILGTRAVRLAPESRLIPWQAPEPRVVIRPIRPADGEALERFYRDLSAESRWARFFGATAGISPGQSSSFCSPDHQHREGFIAELPATSSDSARLVGHLCLEPDGRRSAEVAIAVADRFQGRGIGRRLMSAGLEWAGRQGIETLTATMLEGNVGIRRLLTGMGLPATFHPQGSNVLALTIYLRRRSVAA